MEIGGNRLQLLALLCLADAWYTAGAEMLRNGPVLWASGILALVLALICLIRTARTPYPEECANALALIFHGIAAVFFCAAAVLCAGRYHLLPDPGAARQLLRYDPDDGLAYIVTSCGFLASVVGFAACVLLVSVCIIVRRDASR